MPAIIWDHVWIGSVGKVDGLVAMPWVLAGWPLLDL